MWEVCEEVCVDLVVLVEVGCYVDDYGLWLYIYVFV